MSFSFAKIEIISQSRKDFDRNFEQAMTPILLKAFQISVVSVFIFSF
jgi:hypothetical protein